VTVTLKYDDAKIPQGVDESTLYVAWRDRDNGEWQELESKVDVGAKTAAAQVSHFTEFTVLAPSKPAEFTTIDLAISPAEVTEGEMITVSVKLCNTGDFSGSCSVTLKIDGSLVASKDVVLMGRGEQLVTFTTSRAVAGTYEVDVNGLIGSIVVITPLPTQNPEPATTPIQEPVTTLTPAPTIPQTEPLPAPTTNWPLVLGIAGGVILVGLFSVFVVRRIIWWRDGG
jgi:hypothetical protein